jgi:para-aminobenzoate synthetase/4-amino-4-deoxychorismate lyase
MPPAGSRPTALIDFRSPDDGVAPLRLAFGAPRERLRAATPAEVVPLLARVDALARAGAWCVGHVRYEAAVAFDAAFATHAPGPGPLAAFDVHDAPLDGAAADAAWRAGAHAAAEVRWSDGPGRAAFDATIAAIHRAIRDGEVYQVNATAPLAGLLEGDPFALFAALRRAQPDAYAALLDSGDGDAVLSVSPELFFDRRGERLLARPMKGTAPRGADAAADAAQAAHLRGSPKERAENLMIVDLLRNDLSRVAEPFSVQVPRLFHVEAWPTVWQMCSDVVARARPGTTLVDVFRALFPCGSVTGAPKVRAMGLIRALESGPRGVYCGAVGVVRPGGDATFNVPIRTLALRRTGDATQVRCGVGSGITIDATADGEWDEWRHKRAFLDRASRAFELLETLRLEQGVFPDGEAHLARMAAAAAHFGFASPEAAARAALARVAGAQPAGARRVRLLADPEGAAQVEAFPLAPTAQPVRVRLATRPLVEAGGEFVRFKTTRRGHYDAFAPAEPGVFDTLLWNERGQLTEFTRGNVALRLDGRWITPTPACGLLQGVGRARLLREGVVAEGIVTRDDLARADGLAFFNALRGWLVAELDDAAQGA